MRLFGLSVRPVLQGMGLALGGFAAVNQFAGWLHPGFDANLWWVDFPLLPQFLAEALLTVFAAVLLAWSLVPQLRPWRRAVSLVVLTFVLCVAVGNAITYYRLLWRGVIGTTLPLPFSLLIAAQLLATAFLIWRGESPVAPAPRRRLASVVLGCLLWAAMFPLAQALLYGKTDYRRPADAILVFGARVYANGEPSLAVADRVRTGVELYHAGLAPRLIMSGGPGDGAVHETEAMQALAVELNVPPRDIVRDESGVSTQASVRNLQALAKDHLFRRVLAVSQYWHLPRIKLAAGRGQVQLLTVPAQETRPLRYLPYQLAREVAAFWKYYGTLITSRG